MFELQTEPQWDLLTFPVSLREVRTEYDGKLHLLPHIRSVYREDTREVLDLVSNRYRLVPHPEIFRPLHDQVLPHLPFPVKSVRTSVGRGGGLAQVEWVFSHEVEVQPGDRVALSLLVRNSLDRSARLRLELAARRLICSNGMRGPGPSFIRAWTHLKGALNPATVLEWAQGLMTRSPEAVNEWQAWTRIRLFPYRLETFLREDSQASQLVGQKAREGVLSRLKGHAVDYKVTLWDAYNVLTEYATHRVRVRKRDLLLVRQEEIHRLAQRFVNSVTSN